MSNASKAGVSIFLGSAQFSIFLVLAEILFPNYNVSTNYISDLGAFCPSTGPCVIEPSADVFNGSIILLGLLILLGAYYLQRAFHSTPTAAIVALAGVGAIGVGLFPETTGIWHSVFSLIVFLFAGLAAVLTYRYQKRPMSYFSIALGVITLAALVLFIGKVYLGLGAGGMERIVVYPVLIWSLGFGGHMMSTDDPARP
ncbi:MAG: DUF998 domain-containing protein [Nitrososphaerota archaeon]|nr:DUF998 domain-containing protein [Nitrososphaerota archaeon]